MSKVKENQYKSIMDIAPDQAKNTKDSCVCDNCGTTFKPKETLMEKCNNILFQGMLGIKGITKGKNTWYLVSPCCKTTHLFGFNIVKQ